MHTLSNILFGVFLLPPVETQIEYQRTQEQPSELLVFSWQSECNSETYCHDCWNGAASPPDRSALSRDGFSAHLPCPGAPPEHRPAIMPRCSALLLPSLLASPVCPGVNKDRGDHSSVSAVYGGKRNRRCFHKMPQIKCHSVTGRDGTRVSAVTRILIRYRFAFAPGRELLQGRASGSPGRGVPQSCEGSPCRDQPRSCSSLPRHPLLRLKIGKKKHHGLSSCRVAYPPASRGQTRIKISQWYQTGSWARWKGKRPASSERRMLAASGGMEELKITSTRREREVTAQDKPDVGNLISFTLLSFRSVTLAHFILPAQSPLKGLLGQRQTQSSSLQPYIQKKKKRQKNL